MSVASAMRDRVRAGGLIEPEQPLVVLLSGGRDSTCLLDLAATLAGAGSVYALHLNYGLRESAAGDERHCRELCTSLEVALQVVEPSAPAHGNVQAWAREQRFEAASQLSNRLDGARIATGYTATDQVETVLYRLISSPSRRALIGTQELTGKVIRPLLEFSREQTGDYCTERGLQWVDDETNATDKYVRNRIRNQLVPLLNELHPGAERNILGLAATLRDEQLVLDGLVEAELGDRGRIDGGLAPAELVIGLRRLRQLPPGLARLVLQRMADAVNDEPAPGAARRLSEILALPEVGTAHLDLPHRIRATVTDGVLRFTETDAKPRDRK
jgi:tRNA(Ile)-lysidine synthase